MAWTVWTELTKKKDCGGHDWEYGKLVEMFNPADVVAISKIKLPARSTDDFLAWHCEKTGRFSVRRTLELDGKCTICGTEDESSYHATVGYPRARDLRMAMREFWLLSEEELWRFTGPDWLLLLLDRCTKEQRNLLRLMLWHTWTVHNNLTHNSGPIGTYDSIHFLINYRDILLQSPDKQVPDEKGKKVQWEGTSAKEQSMERTSATRIRWLPPQDGWTKINVDGAYLEQTGKSGCGVVAKDSRGKVVFTAWRALFNCASAAEAEAWALC
ncbi:hypothetical protein BS78_07G118500 [Paspalum vaginatum]|nr:hypothetical protein BS78_07G118500 [Paspalum vaginatum]